MLRDQVADYQSPVSGSSPQVISNDCKDEVVTNHTLPALEDSATMLEETTARVPTVTHPSSPSVSKITEDLIDKSQSELDQSEQSWESLSNAGHDIGQNDASTEPEEVDGLTKRVKQSAPLHKSSSIPALPIKDYAEDQDKDTTNIAKGRKTSPVQCIICMADVPRANAPKLECHHRMCKKCLEREFRMSMIDAQLMPPRCCTKTFISVKHVDTLFDINFKIAWNRKFIEFSTKNRLYCPHSGCGTWIRPHNVRRVDGRRIGRCPKCKSRACGTCKGKWHKSPNCTPSSLVAQSSQEDGRKEEDVTVRRCFRCHLRVWSTDGSNIAMWYAQPSRPKCFCNITSQLTHIVNVVLVSVWYVQLIGRLVSVQVHQKVMRRQTLSKAVLLSRNKRTNTMTVALA